MKANKADHFDYHGVPSPACRPWTRMMKIPNKIRLNITDQQLELGYASGEEFALPAEFLRVMSPSAEVQGHGNPVLQTGKQFVRLTNVEAAGNYALKLSFDDGHDSGLYTWDYLYRLGSRQQELWQDYLEQLRNANQFRDPSQSAV